MFRWLIFLFLTGTLTAQNELKVMTAVANDGDGIFSMLRRYNLDKCPDNLRKFCELNELDQNDPLLKGKNYYLPVYCCEYNGESIRSTMGHNDWDRAVRIAEFNKILHQKNLVEGPYTQTHQLLIPFHEIEEEAELPSPELVGSTLLEVPLFGKANEKFYVTSKKLKDHVYYIVAGHGGPDPGAIYNGGHFRLCEDEYAYDVSLRLAKKLMQQGATVHIVIQDEDDGIRSGELLDCDQDEVSMNGAGIPLNQLKRLKQRTTDINSHYYKYKKQNKKQLVLAIHVDSRHSGKRQDVFFYHHPKSLTGRKVALNLQNYFAAQYKKYRRSGLYEGTVSGRNLYIIREALPPVVYIELANIRNPLDQKRIMIESNREALAEWILAGASIAL